MLALASLAVASAPLAASAQPLGHGGGWTGGGREYGRGGGNGGAVVAAGIFGLIAGAAIASADHQAYAQPYAYGEPYGYAPQCGWQTERYITPWGHVEYRQVQVCN
jgi:hypothetical protein